MLLQMVHETIQVKLSRELTFDITMIGVAVMIRADVFALTRSC